MPGARILIFSLFTDRRDGAAVFKRLANALAGRGIQYIIFTTYERDQKSYIKMVCKAMMLPKKFLFADYKSNPSPEILDMYSQDQRADAEIWKTAQPDATIEFESTIQGALEVARRFGNEHGGMQALITGSQYLVGGALSLLQDANNPSLEVDEVASEA